MLRAYLTQIGRAPLLTKEDEGEIGRRIEEEEAQILRQVVRLDAGIEKVLSIRDEVLAGELRLSNVIKGAGIRLRPEVSIAKKYARCGVPLLDLIQEGNLGLMKAVDKFDYARGYRFSTYGSWWIMQSVARAAAEQSNVFRLPVHLTERRGRALALASEMRDELGRKPTTEELSELLGMSTTALRRMMALVREPISLDAPVPGDDFLKLADLIEDERSPEPASRFATSELRRQIRRLLASLNPREERILRLRFGIGERGEHTLEQVGREFSITRERVRQIQKKAIASLRCPFWAEELEYFLESH